MMLLRTVSIMIASSAVFVPVAVAPAPRQDYAIGQVWTYHTRHEDLRSLLKIVRIDDGSGPAAGGIYHISVIGLHFGGSIAAVTFAPSGFAKALDNSVMATVHSSARFPKSSAQSNDGRMSAGDAFDIRVQDIVQIVDLVGLEAPF